MYVKVRAITGAKKEHVEEAGKDTLRIYVKEKAERNMANRRIIEIVARHFSVRPAEVRIVSGHTSPSKIVSVPDGCVSCAAGEK